MIGPTSQSEPSPLDDVWQIIVEAVTGIVILEISNRFIEGMPWIVCIALTVDPAPR